MSPPIEIAEQITDRERDIIACLAERLSNREIAERLFIAESTVKWYVKQINSKLYTRNRRGIVARADELGLLETEQSEPETLFQRPRENLPRQTTPFIGRTQEITEIHDLLLQEKVRLLTILAPGGMGKTRVALEVAEQLLANFPDGVYFIELTSLTTQEQIIQEIASSIGFIYLPDQRTFEEALLNFLTNKRILLLMDNWEHLHDYSSLLNDLLLASPDLKLLVTSRERLRLMSETVYTLQGMRYSTDDGLDNFERQDAVQLMVSAARRTQVDWKITEDNFESVSRLLHLTEGMPLGILLATSWMDTLSLDRIADEIEQNIAFLETDMQDLPVRHRSMRGVFDHTWQRLREDEQAVIMKFSLFRGGCTYEAAETIAGATVHILQQLVNKALLMRTQSGRYDMHELLRQYCYEKLESSGTRETSEIIYIHYFAEYVAGFTQHSQDHRELEVYMAMDVDIENAISAWHIATRHHYFDLIDSMAFAIWDHLGFCQRFNDFENLVVQTVKQIAHVKTSESKLLIANLYCWTARHLFNGRENDRVAKMLETHLPVVMQQGTSQHHVFHGDLACWQIIAAKGSIEDAFQALLDYTEMCEKLGNLWGAAHGYFYCFALQHDFPNLKKHKTDFLEKANVTYTQINHREGKIKVLIFMGYLALEQYRLTDAIYYTERAYQLRTAYDEIRGVHNLQNGVLNNLGLLELTRNNLDTAEHFFQMYLSVVHNSSNQRSHKDAYSYLALVTFLRGKFEESENYVQKWHTIHVHDYPDGPEPGIVIERRIMDGEYSAAYQLAVKMGENEIAHKDWFNSAHVHYHIGIAASFCERYDEAITHMVAACSHFIRVYPTWSLNVMVAAFASIITADGEFEGATAMLALVLDPPDTLIFLKRIPALIELQENLKQSLGKEAFARAWAHGLTLDVYTVITEMLDRYADYLPSD